MMQGKNAQCKNGYLMRIVMLSVKTLLGICAAFQMSSVHAQAGVPTSATAVTVRSMAEAMNALVSRYAYVVTLETPQYIYEGDLEDQPAQTRNDADRVAAGTAPKILVSRSISMMLNLPTRSAIGRDEMLSIANLVAQSASKNDRGAHYRVAQEGDAFHLIPTEVRDANGNWSPLTPIFDTQISLPAEERSLLETVNAICSALGAAANIRIGLLQAPMKTLIHSSSTVGATNESARTVLTRALASTNNKLTWRVFYDVPLHKYLLSVIYVPEQPSGAITTNATQGIQSRH